ncbi:DUF6438 domain-containing protein [Novosphingobium guangzhouense]|uniref:DUF6438 domain-containing protein n=1 Tax=Novosphingobium guangzhouense TaxID=1850347 RepID=A0A2K2G065_9SPHN|nr:DUF6438 domain-containing protein [Novosphingobium guangzhouense]PNU04423.1 hypothetical protein A8V01_20160 [Novosphingobium guangzhouense]
MRGPLLCGIVLGAGLLSSCAPRVQPGVSSPAPAGEELRISRGPCFGFCPVYSVSVTPAGRVDFTGKRHTAVIGPRAHSISRATYEQVRRALAALRPHTGEQATHACSEAATDMSSITVEWIGADGARTSLTYNMGCRSPEGSAMARTVDEQLGRLGVTDWAAQKTWPGDSRG